MDESLTGTFEQLVVEDKAGEVVGVVVAHDRDPVNDHCRVTMLLADPEGAWHLGCEALNGFARQLFRTYPLRKVSAEIPATTARFTIAEELRAHWAVTGVEQDTIIVVTYRDLWSATAAHVIAAAHSS